SNIGVNIWVIACSITLSITVGIPSFRTPPFGLGISTLSTGCGLYFLSRISSLIPFSILYHNLIQIVLTIFWLLFLYFLLLYFLDLLLLFLPYYLLLMLFHLHHKLSLFLDLCFYLKFVAHMLILIIPFPVLIVYI